MLKNQPTILRDMISQEDEGFYICVHYLDFFFFQRISFPDPVFPNEAGTTSFPISAKQHNTFNFSKDSAKNVFFIALKRD